MIALTKEFVIVDVRPVILTGRGIQKALRAVFGISESYSQMESLTVYS